MVGQWRHPPLLLQCQEDPTFGSVLQALSLLWGCDHSKLAPYRVPFCLWSYFSYHLKLCCRWQASLLSLPGPVAAFKTGVSRGQFIWPLSLGDIAHPWNCVFLATTAFNGSWFWLKHEGFYSSALAGTPGSCWSLFLVNISDTNSARFIQSNAFSLGFAKWFFFKRKTSSLT